MLSTDGQVQEAINNGFKDSTVLTIAHRLDNIVMSDRIMVFLVYLQKYKDYKQLGV